MDFALAIDINRKDLARIVAGLVAMLGSFAVLILPRSTHRAIYSELRPAESALRRLIAVLARDLNAPVRGIRTAPDGAIPRGEGTRGPVFALFDPRRPVGPFEKRVPGHGPGVRGFDDVERFAPQASTPSPDDPIDAQRLSRRVQALQKALDDMPAQARRLAGILAQGKSKWRRVMRPGRPPGHRDGRAGRRRPVDAILVECQNLALLALHPPEP